MPSLPQQPQPLLVPRAIGAMGLALCLHSHRLMVTLPPLHEQGMQWAAFQPDSMQILILGQYFALVAALLPLPQVQVPLPWPLPPWPLFLARLAKIPTLAVLVPPWLPSMTRRLLPC